METRKTGYSNGSLDFEEIQKFQFPSTSSSAYHDVISVFHLHVIHCGFQTPASKVGRAICRCGREFLLTCLTAVCGMPGGILLFIPLYHPLHDFFGVHNENCVMLLFTIYLCIIWSADRHPGVNARRGPTDKVHETTGPCEPMQDVINAVGMNLPRRKYFCVTDYDEAYFDFHCTPTGKPPGYFYEWYTICGIPFENRVEYITQSSGQLVEFQNGFEADKILYYVLQKGYTCQNTPGHNQYPDPAIFLGGKRDVSQFDNAWMWIETRVAIDFFLWGPGQPNGVGDTECLALLCTEGFQWADIPCRNANGYICEVSPSS
ncbi:unnamed protein product [Cyprideis torosa]|uniref:Uncharacterized protein n=1 Tax=Cyprideis torosa TaxID=163714 RepID=A0A7R8ZP66_9CRUS|nr:unnamed protein product [Cyprideis torosa]CAG0898078.1 unnamed protein product [Cyprideis torosa]